MTHLTAKTAATVTGRFTANGRRRMESFGRTLMAGHMSSPAELAFCSSPENFLEMCRLGLHYSVTGGAPMRDLAPRLCGCHHLNDDVPTSKPRGASAGARAPAGEE